MPIIQLTDQEKKEVEFAENFATYHHAYVGQTRKFLGEDYINHPRSCVEILKQHANVIPVTATMYKVMWLHDLVEDTKCTYNQLVCQMGMDTGVGVYYLTNTHVGKISAEEKIELQVNRLKSAPLEIQTLKYVDILDNTSDNVPESHFQWARSYGESKLSFLKQVKGGHEILWKKAYESANTFGRG